MSSSLRTNDVSLHRCASDSWYTLSSPGRGAAAAFESAAPVPIAFKMGGAEQRRMFLPLRDENQSPEVQIVSLITGIRPIWLNPCEFALSDPRNLRASKRIGRPFPRSRGRSCRQWRVRKTNSNAHSKLLKSEPSSETTISTVSGSDYHERS